MNEPPSSHVTADDIRPPLDTASIERDLHAVEAALDRLDNGTYWTDDDGNDLPDDVLAADPLARRA